MRLSGLPRRLAFTIIELLVVIAIISILASLLLPVVGEARAVARSTKCISNLHQLGVALGLYQNAWACFPAHQWKLGPGGAVRYRWFQQLHKMLGFSEEVQQCPEVRTWICGRNNSYGYNYKYLGSAREFPALSGSGTTFEQFPVKRVDSPAHTIAFGDSSGTGTREPYEPIPFEQASSGLSYDARKVLVGNHGYTLDPTFLPNRSQQLWNLKPSEDLWSDKQSPTFIAPRHGGKANFCMVDGHVESLTPREVYADNGWWNGYGSEDPHDEHAGAKMPGLNARYGW